VGFSHSGVLLEAGGRLVDGDGRKERSW
jgi:hypothetical protein